MKKQKTIIQDGITLIALVITIIILLILAGVTISLVLGNNGILNRAEDSVKITKIKEAEEFARMSYMERQIDEIVEGKSATIAGVISDLKEEGYTIKQESENGNNIIGIALSEENVTVERNTSKTVTYTLVYSGETTVRYFIVIQGKYYEIDFNNGNITISTEEANLGEPTKEPEVIVESSDSSIIEATKTEEGTILLTAKDKIGDVEIILKEVNSGVVRKFIATIEFIAGPTIMVENKDEWTNELKLVTISTKEENVTKYTTDGSEPTATNGIEYTGELKIENNCIIKARYISEELKKESEITIEEINKIDKTPPEGLEIVNMVTGTKTIKVTVGNEEDKQSGASGEYSYKISYGTMDREWSEYTKDTTYLFENIYGNFLGVDCVIKVRTKDNVGNVTDELEVSAKTSGFDTNFYKTFSSRYNLYVLA